MIKLGSYFSAVSNQELERRLKLVQKAMALKNVDCLLAVGFNIAQGSGVKYFSDWAPTEFGCIVLIPKDGGITYIGHGPTGGLSVPPDAARGYEQNIAFPFLPALPYLNHIWPSEVVKYLKYRGYKNIALYRKHFVSYLVVDAIRENIAGYAFIDLDDEIDYIQAIKSQEEIAEFRRMSAIHDNLYSCCRCFVRPGRTEREISIDIKKVAMDLNCEELNIMIGAGNPIGKHKWFLNQNSLVKDGDTIDLLIEVTGPGGYFSEVSRMWSLGDPSPVLQKAFSDALEIQGRLAKMAKPGVPAAELMKELHRFQDEHGYYREARLFGHSQGFDVVMRPCFMLEETMELRENMFFAIHPGCGNDKIWAMVTDNFLITKNGGIKFGNTPQEIYVVQ